MNNPSEITSAEHEANMVQFSVLNPLNGKITGEAGRSVLMKSGLPPAVLGQIWSLSDLDHDGYLDQREFSIAMKLTRNCLSGIPLPQHLPPSMLNVPLSGSMSLPRAPPPIPQMPSHPMMGMSMPMGPPPNLPMGGMMGGSIHGLGMGMNTGPSHIPPMPGAYPLHGMNHPTGMGQFPVFNTAPAGVLGGSPVKAPPLPGRPPTTFPGKQLDNWTMPQQNKLKYAQQFNTIDKQRTGYLNGPAARNALGQSGLPTHALAHIWTLSDVNKDGRLSVEEFSIALWLIDQHKTGFALPAELPQELAALTHHGASRSDSPATPSSGEAPAQKVSTPKTFEDKRKDNYDRGQAELDRRRQMLQEEEDRRRAEEQKKEREAEEKRERERQEIERRREAERQAEMERRRQMEEERLEEERKRAAERERQRQEAEKEKKKIGLERRKRELMAQKAAAAEKTATQEQKKKTLQFQLQALEEKENDLNLEVTKARDAIEAITKDIEGMRAVRDEKMAAIAEAQKENQTAAVEAEQLAHQLLQLQGVNKEATERAAGMDELIQRRAAAASRVEEMKRQVEATRERNRQQRSNVEQKSAELANGLRITVEKLKGEHAAALARAEEKKRALHMKLNASSVPPSSSFTAPSMPAEQYDAPPAMYDAPPDVTQQSSFISSPIKSVPPSSLPTYDTPPVVPESSFSNGHHDTSSNGPLPTNSQATVKYRSIYAFDARSEDELSFQPGDVILVFEGHAAEPGWLAGQIKEKVGWFPSAFAEVIAPVSTNVASPMQTVPSNVTPSPSLEKILEEPNASSPPSTLTLTSPTQNGGSVGGPVGHHEVLCVCTANFPWKARNADDLSFSKGDHIEVIEKTDMKWRGRKTMDGSMGWFPKSYVKVVQEGSSVSRQASVASAGSNVTPGSSNQSIISGMNQSTSNHSVVSVIEKNGHHTTVQPQPPSSSAPEWYVAVYDFEAAEPTDLPLKTGERIMVTEKNDAWWKGSCNGREGIFPANYVEPIDEMATPIAHPTKTASDTVIQQRAKVIAPFKAAGENQLSLRVDDIVIVRSKSEAGWWEGEITDASGHTSIGWFPGDYVQLEPSSVAAVTSPVGQTFTALFDYDATQSDELSFKVGDTIIVVAQTDREWWTGYRIGEPTKHGLFPANYVQSRVSPPSPVSPPINNRLQYLIKELIETEIRYHSDLILVRELFYRNLQSVLDETTLQSIFLNLQELIDLSAYLSSKLHHESPGILFSREIDRMSAFVTFCSQQTSALQKLEFVLQSPEVRRIYTMCCQNENSRGLSLSYFLLIPLGRVTRYPLLFEKMFSSTTPQSNLHASFEMAKELLSAVVAEVNLSIRERENLEMLCWSQQHIKCDGLREKIEFTSMTRYQGSRSFLHSGILYKSHSGRLLIAILFNDFLLLSTPDEHLHEVEGFKVTNSTDVSLTLYKTPLLLSKMEVVPISKEKDDDVSLSLKYGDDVIYLRTPNRNARTLWIRQLEESIGVALIAVSEISRKSSVVIYDNPSGRLLIEIMSISECDHKIHEMNLVFRISLDKDICLLECPQENDLTQLKLTTQFAFSSPHSILHVGIFSKRFFAPDTPLYDEAIIELNSILSECSLHRGPLIKQIPLKPIYTSARGRKDALRLKLVVQMFDL